MSINRTQDTVRSHYTWETNDRFETTWSNCTRPRPGHCETKVETKTS